MTARLRKGERMAGAGAAVLLVSLFFDWFAPEIEPRITETSGQILQPELHRSGWTSLGFLMIFLLLAVLVLAAWLVFSTLAAATISQPVAAGVISAAVSSLALGALVVRVTLLQPGLGVGAPDRLVEVQPPAYVGIASLALVVVGSWWSVADERTDAPESAYAPPPARPTPRGRS